MNIQQLIRYKTKVTILYNQNERNRLVYKFGCINAVKGRYKLLCRQHVSYSKLRSTNGSVLRIIELHGKQILHSKQITYIAPNYKNKKSHGAKIYDDTVLVINGVRKKYVIKSGGEES